MRQVLCVAAAMLGLVGFGAAARGDDATAAKPLQYVVIKCRLIEYDTDGNKCNVSEPTMTTLEDRACSAFCGHSIPALTGDNKIRYIDVGTSITLVARELKGGKVLLDGSAEYSWQELAPNSKLRIRRVGSQFIETIRLGEVFRVDLENSKDDGSGRTLELTAEKADAAAK